MQPNNSAETSEISIHQLKVFLIVKESNTWMTADEIAKATGVKRRTASAHAKRLVELGIFDLAEVYPGHRYRFSAMGEKRNAAYMLRLAHAQDAFGLL